MALYNADLKPLENGTSTHSYEHATRLFLTDNYRLAPKQSFLYYVCINVANGVSDNFAGGLSTAISGVLSGETSTQNLFEQYETGLMVRQVDLPKYTIQTKTLNAYNRKNIVQERIIYDPLNITFHDDAADTVTTFWNDYYTYYYRDSDYSGPIYQLPHKYNPRQKSGWGYTPRLSSRKPFLKNIQIFSLHNKRFTEYQLINPMITSWRHGEHNSYDDVGTLQNTMTVAYETVKYRTGFVNAVDVNGFGILHYDNTPSPISTSTTNIYTSGGLVGAITEGSKDLSRPDGIGSGSGLYSQILSAYKLYQGSKGANFPSVEQISIGLGAQILNGVLNSATTQAYTFP
jgi:hypothetical protein